MQTVTILRTLWRLRLLSFLVVLVAVIAGVLVAFRVSLPPKLESRKYDVGVATARILVDTPASQVVDVAPKGSDTLGVRANLLANLMVDGEVKTVIARRAGLRPNQLSGVGDSVTGPPTATAKVDPRGYVLSTRVVSTSDGSWLPIIEIETQAPRASGAATLANAAVSGLREYLDSKAASERVPDASRLRVSGLGVAQARTATRGPRMLYAVGAALAITLFGFAALVLMSTLVANFRATSTPDPVEGDSLDATPESGELSDAWPHRPSAGPPQAVPGDPHLRERAS
jgi:hypothetical protein